MEHLQVWHGITVKREVEIVVERALKGKEGPGWQQNVESEHVDKEGNVAIRNRKHVDLNKSIGTATSTDMQRVGEQVKEGDGSAKSSHSSHIKEGDKKKYYCKLVGCSAKFSRRGNFENHTKKVHGISSGSADITDMLGGQKSVAFCAELAEQKQPSSSLPSPHQTENFENMSMESDSASTYDKKLTNKWRPKVTCEECGMIMCKTSLKTHMRTNHTENQDKPHRCKAPNCGARYPRSWLLRRHMKIFHKERGKGIKKMESLKVIHCCQVEGCDATFATRPYLRRHIQVFHDGKEERDI